ncbi:unnamed protein product [Sphagnum tenellum]
MGVMCTRRGGLVDPFCIGQLAGDNSSLPGVQLDLLSLLTGGHAVANPDCADQLDPSDVVGFPHHVELQYAMLNVNAMPKGMMVIHCTKELGDKQAKSRIWNETWLSGLFFKPCNYKLFVKQFLNIEMAIVFAREAGMDWIIHLDSDELLHPAGIHYCLNSITGGGAALVIVQGLQEAGIFSDALHVGQTHLEKSQSQEVFMSSVSWPNSIQAAATGELTIVNEFQAAK